MKNREDFKEYEKAFLTQNSYLNLISKNDEKLLWEKHIFDSLAIEKFFEKYTTDAKMHRGIEAKSNNSYASMHQNVYASDSKSLLFQHTYSLLDIGTGGGFPAVPIAISYPEIEVYALDSIRKKINAIENIKAELGLKNLHMICDRAENLIIDAKRYRGIEAKQDNNYASMHPSVYTSNTNHSIFLPASFDIITSRAVAPIKVIAEYAMPLLKYDGYFIAYKSLKAQEEIEDAKQILKKHKAQIIDIIQYDLPLEENYTRNLVVISKK